MEHSNVRIVNLDRVLACGAGKQACGALEKRREWQPCSPRDTSRIVEKLA